MKDATALTVNEILAAVPLGTEELHAVAIIGDAPVRFVVVKVYFGEAGELVLVLERRTILERKTR